MVVDEYDGERLLQEISETKQILHELMFAPEEEKVYWFSRLASLLYEAGRLGLLEEAAEA